MSIKSKLLFPLEGGKIGKNLWSEILPCPFPLQINTPVMLILLLHLSIRKTKDADLLFRRYKPIIAQLRKMCLYWANFKLAAIFSSLVFLQILLCCSIWLFTISPTVSFFKPRTRQIRCCSN